MIFLELKIAQMAINRQIQQLWAHDPKAMKKILLK